MERSKKLSGNRRVYRSRHLLDEDVSVRGANLAGIYRDAGMQEVSLREAADAVNASYASYSGHLFLANSFLDIRNTGSLYFGLESGKSASPADETS